MKYEIHLKSKIRLMLVFVSFAFAASAVAPWSDTPVTCHWIGAVKMGTTTYGNYASWTNADNWAEGIVPGMSIVDGVTNGCFGCTAVFDRPCTYGAIDFIYGQAVVISNIIVTGSTVPKITFGRPWDYTNPNLFLENGGGIYIDASVVATPEMRAAIKYVLGTAPHKLYFENNTSTPFTMRGFQGVATKFPEWSTMWLVMRGTGGFIQKGTYINSGGGVRLNLDMNGGKFVQEASATIFTIDASTTNVPQHLELSDGVTLKMSGNSVTIYANEDLLIDGNGTCDFDAAASSTVAFGEIAGKTVTFDCDVVRKVGGALQIGSWSPYNAGTFALTAGRSFDSPVQFFGGTLKLPDGMVFTNAISILESRSGTIAGGSENEAKITGGVAGTTRPLTLKGRLAIASDVTATTTLDADAAISFRKADADDTAFAISSLKLMGDTTIPVEDGVTATIAAINNNGYTLDIRPAGTGKVVFSGLAAGFAPAWLTINGRRGVIAGSGELTDRDAVADDTAIDAHGGVVPNASASAVAVTTANGPAAEYVTLAEDATSVMMLRQRQAVDDVQIDMSAGQTLSAGLVSVVSGAKPLTVGSAAGTGVLAPNGEALELETEDAASKMTVNAAVAIPADKRLVKAGAGVVAFAGPATGLMDVQSGSLVFTNGGSGVTFTASNATMVAEGALASGSFRTILTNGRVEMSGCLDSAYFVAASNGVGRIEMTGGCVTGGLLCAANSSSFGTFRMTGGEFVNPTTGNYSGLGYAYTKIDGGVCRMTASGNVFPAYGHNGVFEQTGGEFRREGGFRVGGANGALGVVCIKGGEFQCTGDNIVMPHYNCNASGILTVEGDDAQVELDSNKSIYLACVNDDQNGGRGYGNTSMVNLNGGKLAAKAIVRCGSYSNSAEKGYVNFNGGTFKPANYIQPFGSVVDGSWEWRPDRVTSFEKGATIEIGDSGYTYVPIQAPYGKGVESIAWSPVSGLPGAPVVVIEDPDGTGAGASAFADVDDYGTITNVHVTSPGWNYTRATAKLYSEIGILVATFDCTLKEQKSGGLTKTGAGRLELRCQNTYTGDTVIKGGTLKLMCEDAIDARSALVFAGGKLDLDSHSQTFSSVSGSASAGDILNGTVTLSGLAIDFAKALAGDISTIDFTNMSFAPGAMVSLTGYDIAALDGRKQVELFNFTAGGAPSEELTLDPEIELPKGWGLLQTRHGLKIAKHRGIVIDFK